MKIKFLRKENGQTKKAVVLNGEFGFNRTDLGTVKLLSNGIEFETVYFNEITVNCNESYPFEEMGNILFEKEDIKEVKIEVEKTSQGTSVFISIE